MGTRSYHMASKKCASSGRLPEPGLFALDIAFSSRSMWLGLGALYRCECRARSFLPVLYFVPPATFRLAGPIILFRLHSLQDPRKEGSWPACCDIMRLANDSSGERMRTRGHGMMHPATSDWDANLADSRDFLEV